MTSITDKIVEIARHLTEYAMVLAAVGTVTMALLELLKSLFDARMRFHRWRIKKWAAAGALAQLELLATGAAPRREAVRALHGFLTGEMQRADVMYDQPTDKMMGQIQAAANVALDFPQRYADLYRFLAVPLGDKGDKDAAADADRWLEYAEAIAKGSPQPDDKARAATQARARIGNIVARKLDAFQNETQYLWADLNQRVAVISAAAFLAYLLWSATVDPGAGDVVRVVTLSFLGGLVAPFAKDVVSALSSIGFRAK